MTAPVLKVCGLTTIADLRVAQRSGADFLGVVVEAPDSPRGLDLARARVLARLTDRLVAVTPCGDVARLHAIIAALQPRALQLHGPGAAERAAVLRRQTPVWVAVGVPSETEDPAQVTASALTEVRAAAAAGAEMIVLDTSVAGRTGGTGRTSDWAVAAALVAQSPLPVLLAGGLGPGNALTALDRVKPYGLDCSSGLEAAPGRKSPVLVRELTRLIRL